MVDKNDTAGSQPEVKMIDTTGGNFSVSIEPQAEKVLTTFSGVPLGSKATVGIKPSRKKKVELTSSATTSHQIGGAAPSEPPSDPMDRVFDCTDDGPDFKDRVFDAIDEEESKHDKILIKDHI
jgi:hypothetical protein